MISISMTPGPVMTVTLTGTVTRDDIKTCEKAFEDLLASHERIGMVVDMSGMEDIAADAIAEDLRYELSILDQWHRVPRLAVVSGKQWVAAAVRVLAPLIKAVEIRVFAPAEREDAGPWAAKRAA